MLQRRKLLVILASIFAASSASIEYRKEREDWAKQRPFQVIMSWYLRHAYAITIEIIHRKEGDSIYHDYSSLIPVIHETSDIPVLVTHHVIRAEDYENSNIPLEADHRSSDRNMSISNSSINDPDAFPESGVHQVPCSRKWLDKNRHVTTSVSSVKILLIPDEAAFHEFRKSDEYWCWKEVKFVLIIVLPESRDNLCQGSPDKRAWKESARNILERIWSEDKVLNIFFSAPTSACIEDYLFAWNPFATGAKNLSGSLKRLKVNAEDPSVDMTLSEFIFSVKNMNGYPLKVTIFERLPTLFASLYRQQHHETEQMDRLDINKITGIDGLVLRTLLSWMNSSAELYPPSDDRMYGWKMKNGTFVGMLGDIVYRRADFAANGIFLKDYQTASATEFTIPINCENICIVVPRAGMIPQWMQIFQCFSPLVWYLLFFNVMIYGLLRHIFRLTLRERHPRRNLLETIIETALIFLSSPQNMPRLNPERILVGFYLLFNVIVIGTFQGTLYENFTNPDYYRNIDTLANLDDSGLLISTGSPNLLNIFGVEDDQPTLAHLRKKVQFSQTSSDTGAIDRAAWNRDIAAIERKNDVQFSINTQFLDEHGEPVLHVVDECLSTYHLVYLVPSGAFFLRRMNVLLRRMVESGLIKYWYNSTLDFLILRNRYAMAKKLELKDKARAFDLKNLQTSFIILISGLVLSLIVFIGEKVIVRHKVRGRRVIPKIRIATKNFVPPS